MCGACSTVNVQLIFACGLASKGNMTDSFQNPFEGDADFQYLALDRKKLMEEAAPFDAKTSCWIVDQKEGYMKANIKSTKGEEVTVITETLEVSIQRTGDTNYIAFVSIIINYLSQV